MAHVHSFGQVAPAAAGIIHWYVHFETFVFLPRREFEFWDSVLLLGLFF